MTLADDLRKYLPSWLGDSDPISPSYGFRVLYSIASVADAFLEATLQGSLAAVGRGTPSALKYIGQARGVIRGRYDTNETYAAKLPTWIDRLKERGSQLRLARELFEYLGDARVRVINRAGHWITIETDGTVTTADAAWDWDSVSHPERNDPEAPWWSDLWIVVYPTWAMRSGTLGDLAGEDGYALGHLATTREIDAVKLLLSDWKSAHSCIRAVIWTTDATRFDPAVPASLPDGTWGAWSWNVGGTQVASGRDLTTCRYWEPR